MTRLQETSSWLLSSLGLALLVCSLFLVPATSALAQITGPPPPSCAGNDTCDSGGTSGCFVSLDWGCNGGCSQSTKPTLCGGCKCNNIGGTECACQM